MSFVLWVGSSYVLSHQTIIYYIKVRMKNTIPQSPVESEDRANCKLIILSAS